MIIEYTCKVKSLPQSLPLTQLPFFSWGENVKPTLLANYQYSIEYYYLQSSRFTSDLWNLLVLCNWNSETFDRSLSISLTSLPW